MLKPARPVYLSPHLDDAVLSCGGLIHQQRDLRPLVITLFAGVPDYRALPPFAADQHRRWGDLADPIGHRREEDAAALAHLGAAYEHWDYLDCIYRRDPASGEFLYTSEEALWAEVASADGALVDELTARLSETLASRQQRGTPFAPGGEDPTGEYRRAETQLPPNRWRDAVAVYAPLAVGRHVDHQLVLQVALRLRRLGWPLGFYEDYPYAGDPQQLAWARQSWASPPSPTLVRLSAEDLAARIAAIRCYASQLPNLFGGRAAVAGRVKTYALAVGAGDDYAERYWRGGRP